MIEFGNKVRDRITGFEGIAEARTEWMNRCVRWMVRPQTVDKDGRPSESQQFDEGQLEVVGDGLRAPIRGEVTGGGEETPREF